MFHLTHHQIGILLVVVFVIAFGLVFLEGWAIWSCRNDKHPYGGF